MKPTAEDLINGKISSVGVYLYNKVNNYIFEKEPIETIAIRETDFEKIIEEKTELEEFPEISQEDIKAICEILYNSDDIESIIKQLYVFQSGMNKGLDDIKEDFVSLFPKEIKLKNGKRNLEAVERSSFLLKVFEVLDEGIQIALNRTANEGSSGASNALSNRRHFEMRYELVSGFKDVKQLISKSSRGAQEKEILVEKLPSLFISYAREDDEPFVEKLYQDLKEKGFEIWWDKAAMKNRGRTFLQEIRDAIEDSDLLIAVIGPKAIESDSVRYEWEHALLFSKGMVPILRMGDFKLLLPEMSKLHCPDFREDRPYKEALEELIRLLKEPIPSLGPIIRVPSLPPNHLPRKKDLNIIKEMVLADTVKPVVITSAKQITALQGMGGMGKSVLSTAFSRAAETRRAFCDGIFWVTVGLDFSDSDLIEYMRLIGTKCGDDPANYRSKREAEASLSETLSDKVCLIILDDVWKVPQVTPLVNTLGSRCRLLITTRNDDVVFSLGAQEHKIEVLSEPDALKLLASWCEQEVDSLPSEAAEVARECGYLPLALSICGAMAKSGIPWSHILEALQEADLEFIEAQLPNYPDPNVGRALKVSVDFLSNEDPDAVLRYQELSIFPEDEFVPEATIATLWSHTGNLKERHVGKLLIKLKDRSLLRLDGEAPNRLISLHDLQFDYLRTTAGNLPSLHNKLLEAYGKECGNKWGNGPEDGYFFEHLAYHMKEAGKDEELRKLLLNFEWMCSRLKKVCIIEKENGTKTPDVNSLLHDYDYLLDDKEIGLVQGAIRLSFNTIVKDKTQLAGQLLGRLLCFHEDGIRSLLSQVLECRDNIRLIPITPSLKPPGGPLVRTLEGHNYPVNAISVLANGKYANGRYAVSASIDGMLKIWDLDIGEEKTTQRVPGGGVNKFAVTSDGMHMVLGLTNGTLKVWDLEMGKEKTTLKGHSGVINSVAITSDGKCVISGSEDGTIKLWDLEREKERMTLKGHKWWVNAVEFIQDNKYAISGSQDRTIKIWDLETEEEKATLKGHSDGWVNAIAVTPDKKCAVSGLEDRTLRVWDLENKKEKVTLRGHYGVISAVAVTPNGKCVISASSDQTLKVWDIDTGEEKTTLRGHDGWVNAIAITTDGKYAVSASYGALKIWDLEKEDEITTQKESKDWIIAIAVTTDGKYAVLASLDKSLKVLNVEKGEEKVTLKGHDREVSAVAITPDGKYVVSASPDRTIKVWDIDTGEEKTILKEYNERVREVAISPDGKYIVSASFNGTLKVWNLDSGEENTLLKGHEGKINTVAVTPDGKFAVSASLDRILKVWNLKNKKEKTTLKGHEGIIKTVAITSDGKYVISASEEREHIVWNLENGEKTMLEGDSIRVDKVAIAPNGEYAVEASSGRIIKVWDLKYGKIKTILKWHEGEVNAVAITPDSKYLVSASSDRTIKLWNLEEEKITSIFTGDNFFHNCYVLPDGKFIVAGDALGKMHFLHLEVPD